MVIVGGDDNTVNGDNSCDGGTVAVSPRHQYLLSFIKMMGRRDLGCGSQLSSPVAITTHDPSHTQTHKHTEQHSSQLSSTQLTFNWPQLAAVSSDVARVSHVTLCQCPGV